MASILLPTFGRFPLTLTFFDTSSDYKAAVCWPLSPTPVIIDDFGYSSTRTESKWLRLTSVQQQGYYYYGTFEMHWLEDSSDFIEVYIFFDHEGFVESGAAYDSAGN